VCTQPDAPGAPAGDDLDAGALEKVKFEELADVHE